MAIAQATRELIITLAESPDGPKSVREIAKEVGVSAMSVSRILKESLERESVTKNVTPVTKPSPRARATKTPSVTKSVTKNVTPEVTIIKAVEITRDQTLKDTYDLLRTAQSNLDTAIRESDGTPQALNAINGATRAVAEILKELGKWCGLNESIKSTAPETKPANTLTLDEALEILRKV